MSALENVKHVKAATGNLLRARKAQEACGADFNVLVGCDALAFELFRNGARAPLAVRAAKRMINHAYESTLADGLEEEKRMFYSLFDSEDKKEGMQAFVEKRKPNWTGK